MRDTSTSDLHEYVPNVLFNALRFIVYAVNMHLTKRKRLMNGESQKVLTWKIERRWAQCGRNWIVTIVRFDYSQFLVVCQQYASNEKLSTHIRGKSESANLIGRTCKVAECSELNGDQFTSWFIAGTAWMPPICIRQDTNSMWMGKAGKCLPAR